MNATPLLCPALVLLTMCAATELRGAGPDPGVVSHILVTSNHVEDVSSMEAWQTLVPPRGNE